MSEHIQGAVVSSMQMDVDEVSMTPSALVQTESLYAFQLPETHDFTMSKQVLTMIKGLAVVYGDAFEWGWHSLSNNTNVPIGNYIGNFELIRRGE